MKIRNVLIVEDSENDVFFLKRALQKSGIQLEYIHVASDGRYAIEYLQCVESQKAPAIYPKPQLIFTDLKMPGVDGFQLLNWLKNNPVFATIPKVVMSSSAYDRDVHRAYMEGANSYIRKEHDVIKFVEMVEKVIHYWDQNQLAK